MNTMYKPFEEVLAGYYEFGNHYFVLVGQNLEHQSYTAIHEQTHIFLGTSTSYGIFQQFLSRLDKEHSLREKDPFIAELLLSLIEEVRPVHEAAATYRQFACAEFDNYLGLDSMYKHLDNRYIEWKGIFDQFFDKRIPVRARGELAYYLSRFSMNTPIIQDYKNLSSKNIEGFAEYIADNTNSPRKRLKTILDLLSRHDQLQIFSDFIELYKRNADNDTSQRTYQNRKVSLKISIGLKDKIEQIIAGMRDINEVIPIIYPTSEKIDSDLNDLIKKWNEYFTANHWSTKLEIAFINIDKEQEVDIVEGRQIVIPNFQPQPKLVPIADPTSLPISKSYLTRIYIWEKEEPFLLCEEPLRYLYKGDVYARFIPPNSSYSFFTVSKDVTLISKLVPLGSILLFEAKDYARIFKILDEIGIQVIKNNIYFIWRTWDQFQQEVDPRKRIQVRILQLNKGEVWLFIIKQDERIYHLFLSTGTVRSMAYCDLKCSNNAGPIMSEIVIEQVRLIIEYMEYLF